MSEPTTPSSEHSEPATGPVYTSPASAAQPPPPHTVYIPQPPSRLNKAAAWVGIAAGSVFIVAVIFGTGVFVGTNIGGDAPRHHPRGPVMVHSGPPFPMGPPGGFERGPGFPGPFGSGGPTIDTPRAPGPTPTAPPRP